ncbi:MAG: hypothetical protein WC365_01880 [Candidatus Babeliales bacterium]|jgi:hypothetical protein
MRGINSIILSLCSIIGLQATSYPPFMVSKNDVAGVLARGVTVPITTATKLPADISFACADIKYEDGSLKFCECGDGIYMSLRTAAVTLNDHPQDAVAPYWGILWHYLAQFRLSLWLVGNVTPETALAIPTFKQLGGCCYRNLWHLEQDVTFKKTCTSTFKRQSQIGAYRGIIVFRSGSERGRDSAAIKDFRRNHPEFLYVNSITRPYIIRKDMTSMIFTKAGLTHLIPAAKTYKSTYSPELTHHILNDFSDQWLIIKPVFSSLAYGVNLIDRNDLDNFLQLILRDTKNISRNATRDLSYWRTARSSNFFVSSYAPSRIIYKDNLPYDPTMRIVFMMYHDKGFINVTAIAGFWKIPVTSLAVTQATLTARHITIAHAGDYYTGIMADQQDWNNIKEILDNNLPKLYQTILEQHALPV